MLQTNAKGCHVAVRLSVGYSLGGADSLWLAALLMANAWQQCETG